MGADNGSAPPAKLLPDPGLLTPNDHRRLRKALGGRDPRELLGGEVEDIMQTMILAAKLRTDSTFTWDQAGDIAPSEVLDMSGGDREPDPQTAAPGSPGPADAPSAATPSKAKRRSAAPVPS